MFSKVMRLAREALVVGLVFDVLYFAIHILLMQVMGDAAMTDHRAIAAQAFLAAAAGHLLFEVIGANAFFCESRKNE